MTAEGYYRN